MSQGYKDSRNIFAAMVCGAMLVACGNGSGGAHIDPTDAAQVLRGQAVYQKYCATCHGANREGQHDWRVRKANGRLPAPPHDESGHTWHHPIETLVEIVRDGLVPPNAPEGYASDMPAFKDTLQDDEITAVLAYIESRWGADVQAFRRQNKLDEPP